MRGLSKGFVLRECPRSTIMTTKRKVTSIFASTDEELEKKLNEFIPENAKIISIGHFCGDEYRIVYEINEEN